MSVKYHINDKGEPGVCKANKKPCRFGGNTGQENHYSTLKEARSAFEEQQKSQNILLVKKSNTHGSELYGLEDYSGVLPDSEIFRNRWKSFVLPLKKYINKYGDLSNYDNELVPNLEEPFRWRGEQVVSVGSLDEDSPVFDYINNSDETTKYLLVTARQGGGNRDCYCDGISSEHEDYCLADNNEKLANHPDYLGDFDEEYDSTYNTFIYKINKTDKEIKEYFDKRELYNDAFRVKEELDKIVSDVSISNSPTLGLSEILPWQVGLARRKMETYYRNYRGSNSIESKNNSIKQALEKNETLKSIVEKISLGEITEEDFDKLPITTKTPIWLQKEIINQSKEILNIKKEYAEAVVLEKEVNELPDDSNIKEYFLKDRGSFSYKVTVGKKIVTKTEKNRTVLGDIMYEAEEGMNKISDKKKITYRFRRLNDFTVTLNDLISKNEEIIKKNQDSIDSFESNRKEAWEDGWPNDSINSIPPIPKNF